MAAGPGSPARGSSTTCSARSRMHAGMGLLNALYEAGSMQACMLVFSRVPHACRDQPA